MCLVMLFAVLYLSSFAESRCRTNYQTNVYYTDKTSVLDDVDSVDAESSADIEEPDTVKIITLDLMKVAGSIYTVMYLRYYAPKRNSIVITRGSDDSDTLYLPRADEEMKNFHVVDLKKQEPVFSFNAIGEIGRTITFTNFIFHIYIIPFL